MGKPNYIVSVSERRKREMERGEKNNDEKRMRIKKMKTDDIDRLCDQCCYEERVRIRVTDSPWRDKVRLLRFVIIFIIDTDSQMQVESEKRIR